MWLIDSVQWYWSTNRRSLSPWLKNPRPHYSHPLDLFYFSKSNTCRCFFLTVVSVSEAIHLANINSMPNLCTFLLQIFLSWKSQWKVFNMRLCNDNIYACLQQKMIEMLVVYNWITKTERDFHFLQRKVAIMDNITSSNNSMVCKL